MVAAGALTRGTGHQGATYPVVFDQGKFKIECTGGPHPEDVWSVWLNGAWVQIKIVKDFSPTGEALLFLLADTIQCFVPPKGGL